MKHIRNLIAGMLLAMSASATAGDMVTVVTAQMSDGTRQRFEVAESGKVDFRNREMTVLPNNAATATTLQMAQIERLYFENAESAGAENALAEGIRLYPNPVSDALHIEGIGGETEVVVVSADGKVVMRETVKDGSRLDFTSLQSGVYYVAIEGRTLKIVRL